MHNYPKNRLTAGTIRQRQTGRPVPPLILAAYRPQEPAPDSPYPQIAPEDWEPVLRTWALQEDDPRPSLLVWLAVLAALIIVGAALGALLAAAGTLLR